jgi:uncharacterized protein YutE (UPF0331/DUF86 family)
MVEKDVLLQKVNSIQNCLKRIHDAVGPRRQYLEELDVQDIAAINLQRAVQLVIDIAFYVVQGENLGLPENLKSAFRILEKNKYIDKSLLT